MLVEPDGIEPTTSSMPFNISGLSRRCKPSHREPRIVEIAPLFTI
jgi:hypothetical protein